MNEKTNQGLQYSAVDWANDYINTVVMPSQPGAAQIIETRRAFVAGCHIMLEAAASLGDESVSEEKGLLVLQGLREEIDLFFQDEVRRG